MLSYERRVVASMLTTTDEGQRQQVTDFVGGSLGAMPEVLRLGIFGLSVGLGTWSGARRAVGAGRTPERELVWLEEHPLGLVRQWARALRSLVLFSEQEIMEAAER